MKRYAFDIRNTGDILTFEVAAKSKQEANEVFWRRYPLVRGWHVVEIRRVK